MESGGEGNERVFDAFRGDGFVELLGAGGVGGVGELLGMEEMEVEQKVAGVEREGVGVGFGVGGLLLRCAPAYPPPQSSFPSPSSYRMLCFGGDEGFPNYGGNKGFSHKSSESCSSTSSSSSNSGLPKSKKKTEEGGRTAAAEVGRTATTGTKETATPAKKPRKEHQEGQQSPSSQRRTSKVRKEKLGERITALQQLVSPFGKTDTASVLHEALGYIRFLHDQVQVLSSPYLQRLPTSAHLHGDGGGEAEPRLDLRSRGLCLVPVACTAQVAASNGADFWSPAMGSGGGDDHHHPALSKH